MSELRDIITQKLDFVLVDLYEAGLNAHTLRPSGNVVELCRGEVLSIPEIAKALKLLEESLIKPEESVTQKLPQKDLVTESRLLRADIEQRTIKL